MCIHLLTYAEQESTENRDPRIGETQRGVKPACRKEAVSLSLRSECRTACCWKPQEQHFWKHSWVSILWLLHSDSYVLSACLFVFRRLRCCLMLFSWIAESPKSAYNGILGLLSSSCFMCMSLNKVSKTACILQKYVFLCLCQCCRWWTMMSDWWLWLSFRSLCLKWKKNTRKPWFPMHS